MRAIKCDACDRLIEENQSSFLTGNFIHTFELSKTVRHFPGNQIDLCFVCGNQVADKLREVMTRTKEWE